MRGSSSRRAWILIVSLAVAVPPVFPAETERPGLRSLFRSKGPAATHTAESLATLAKPSVVVISQKGRDGKDEGIGAGVAVASNLIATCLHVIGEARPVTIRLESGERREAVEVHAWDRKLDLAIVRVSGPALRPLALGDAESLKQGAQVVAIGNPLGLEHSIVQGVVSGKREFDGVEMLQLAIPIEPGNSGGPVLDMEGRVQGLLSMKSALSANLGFAVPVSALQKLLDKPNPVPLPRWLSFTTIKTNQWLPLMGARWTQRAGAIRVEGAGEGFGGRSLLLARATAPPPPYELSVEVQLDDESGAAGLIFESDGEDVHYGFYPTSGQLRLTHFEGPTVFTWNILSTVNSAHYRPGEWNHLRVRVEPETLRCYVNGYLVIETAKPALSGGLAGLAKFRHTKATFRNFSLSTALEAPPAAARSLTKASPELFGKSDAELIGLLEAEADHGYEVLRRRSRDLEHEAERLSKLARTVHQRRVLGELRDALARPEGEIDLFHTALLISQLDNPELDVAAYRRAFEELARELAVAVEGASTPAGRLEALKRFFFTEHGFHGSRADYYNKANSYIDRVLEDREGIPITLSVLFMELARRIKLEVAGVPLPGHFIVNYKSAEGEQLLDVFDGGKRLTREEAEAVVMDHGGGALREEHFKPAARRDIVIRMLRNLLRATAGENPRAALAYLDVIVGLAPEDAFDRIERARLRLAAGDSVGAREDLAWILDREPAGIDLEAVRQLFRSL